MSREELWNLIEYHAQSISRSNAPTPYYGPGRALKVEDHAKRISELCHQVYPLDKKAFEESQLTKSTADQCDKAEAQPSNRIR